MMMTIVRRQIPACVAIKSLHAKLKRVFYSSDEAILVLFLAQVFFSYLRLVYLVILQKERLEGVFL